MSDTNENNILGSYFKADLIVKTYFDTFEHLGTDGTYSRVFKYYTGLYTEKMFPPEFVREVLDSLEKNIDTHGQVKARVATLYKYI